jgi:hypothetical protein
MYLSFHRATNVRLSHTYADNGNSVTLEIESEDDGRTEITIYDLPSSVTDKLHALRDQYTTHSVNDKAA